MIAEKGYAKKNGRPVSTLETAEISTTHFYEIEIQYRNLAEILLSAILREPHNFAIDGHRMNPVWWKETEMASVAAAIFRQHYSPARSFSVRTVCIEAGKAGEQIEERRLYDIMQRHQDVELPLALQMFEPVYRQWIEAKCALLAIQGIGQGWEAETIRSEQERFRTEMYANVANDAGENDDFDKWVGAKLDGCEIDYLCKPHLQTVINGRFKVGYEPGELVYAAGRPSMGKTHWLLGEIYNFVKAGARGVFISADMEKLKVQKRLLGQITGNNPKGDWSLMFDAQREIIRNAQKEIETMPLLILDSVVDVNEIAAICIAENYRNKIDFLAIDYVQQLTTSKVTGRARNSSNRNEELSEISRTLKHLAKVLRIPVIALSQLSRAVETRGGSKRPTLSDLRDSGALEQDASVVIFFYRPEYYKILEAEDGRSLKGLGELIFAKQQEDETGDLLCQFNGVTGWSDLFDETMPGEGDEPPASNSYTSDNVVAFRVEINPNREAEKDNDIPF